jgi:hypothetical protein
MMNTVTGLILIVMIVVVHPSLLLPHFAMIAYNATGMTTHAGALQHHTAAHIPPKGHARETVLVCGRITLVLLPLA